MKETNTKMTIIVDIDQKKRFFEECKKNDLTPSQVLRKFIKDYNTDKPTK